jgi:hypothetical protein
VKRPLVLIAALAALLAVVAAGCAPDDQAALTVGGEEVLTIGDLQAQLDELAADEDFLTNSDGRGQGEGTLNAGFTAAVLSNHVLNALIAADLAAEGVEVTDEDVAAGTDLLAQQVGGDIEVIPASYRQTLVELFAGFTALSGALGGEAAAQERAGALLAEAEVEVARRYGRWDPETDSVEPPEGPVTPTTAPLVLPGG